MCEKSPATQPFPHSPITNKLCMHYSWWYEGNTWKVEKRKKEVPHWEGVQQLRICFIKQLQNNKNFAKMKYWFTDVALLILASSALLKNYTCPPPGYLVFRVLLFRFVFPFEISQYSVFFFTDEKWGEILAEQLVTDTQFVPLDTPCAPRQTFPRSPPSYTKLIGPNMEKLDVPQDPGDQLSGRPSKCVPPGMMLKTGAGTRDVGPGWEEGGSMIGNESLD